MNDLLLEPYAVQQRWQMPAPLAGRDWETLLASYLAELAHACTAAGAGHDRPHQGAGAFLGWRLPSYQRREPRSHPPTTDGRAPDGLAELALTLNVLVYGLARDVLSGLAAT